MTILSSEQIAALKQKLSEKGDKTVREELANGNYGEPRKKIVENWLEEFEREKLEARFQQELKQRDQIFREQMQTEETRFKAQLAVSLSQAESAKSASKAAMISAVVAIIAAILSVAPFIYSFLKK